MTKEEADDASVQPTAQQIADRWAARIRQLGLDGTYSAGLELAQQRYQASVERMMPLWQQISAITRKNRRPRQS